MIEYGEELKNQDIIQNKMFEIEKSYMKKEEIIELLNNIDFVLVKKCDLELITGFICDGSTGEIKPLTKNIEID